MICSRLFMPENKSNCWNSQKFWHESFRGPRRQHRKISWAKTHSTRTAINSFRRPPPSTPPARRRRLLTPASSAASPPLLILSFFSTHQDHQGHPLVQVKISWLCQICECDFILIFYNPGYKLLYVCL